MMESAKAYHLKDFVSPCDRIKDEAMLSAAVLC